MRVVVESAPADTACVLWVGGELVVNAGMAYGVLGEALDLVDGFGGVGVPNEFGVEVAGMVWRLEREAEVVHGEHIFEKFRFLKVTDTAGGTSGVEAAGHSISLSVEVVVVLRFIDTDAPQDDARMVPVAADHSADVVDRDLFPRFVADMLPAGNFFENQQAHFIAGIEEVAGLRVV